MLSSLEELDGDNKLYVCKINIGLYFKYTLKP